MMDEIKLKPCPFCGGKADICKFPGCGATIFCSDCQVSTPILDMPVAIQVWNRRVQNET